MKKILVASALLLFLMAGCSSGGGSSAGTASDSPQPNTQDVSQTTENPADQQYYFSDGVLVSEDVKIEITDWKVIPVGEPGNEYGEVPVIAFWYRTTNLTGNEDVTPVNAWIAMFTAVQDNDPNAVNTLDVGMLPDEAYLDSQLQAIKEGGTVDCAVSYELDDLTTPVTLTATNGLFGDEIGEQVFEIA